MENQNVDNREPILKVIGNPTEGFNSLELNNFSEVNFDLHTVKSFNNQIYRFSSIKQLNKINDLLSVKENSNSVAKITKGNINKFLLHLSESLLSTKRIDDLLLKILTYKEFRDFKSITLYIHNKGEQNAKKYEVSRSYKSINKINTKEFNSLFLAIKKSKNRSFGQNELKGINFDILGTFIAKEISLKHYNIIFIVSRNDFLPPSKESLSLFENRIQYLSFFLNEFLNSTLFDFNNAFVNYLNSKILTNENALSMLESKTKHFHLERLELLGELLNTLRHELSNPLFGLELAITFLHDAFVNSPENLEFITEIQKNIKRSLETITNFTDIFQKTSNNKTFNLKDLLEEVFILTKSETRGIYKEIECPDDILLNTSSSLLVHVIFNLILNSSFELKRSEIKDPIIKIKVSVDHDIISINIFDNGTGIPKEERKNIFKPFFTTKENGTGLGLPISQTIIKNLGGQLILNDQVKGTSFLIKLKSNDENTNNRG